MPTFRDVTLTPDQPPALVSLADAKAFLGIADSVSDTFLTNAGLAIASAFEAYCNTILAPRVVVEHIVPEDAWTTVPLAYSGARALTAVSINGVAQNLADYRLMGTSGILGRKDGATLISENVDLELSYSAGYVTLPAAVVQAAKTYIQDMQLSKGRESGIVREAVPDVSDVTYAGGGAAMSVGPSGAALPASVAALLAPYVSWYRT